MTKQEILDYLNNVLHPIVSPDNWNVYSELHDMIEELPSAEPHWIPCSERLPEVRQWVLCQCRAGIMDVLRLTADGSWYKGYPRTEYMGGFVVAWMPLPEPYEVEK